MRTQIDFRFSLFRHFSVRPEQLDVERIDILHSDRAGRSLDEIEEIPTLRWLQSRPELLELLLGQVGLSGHVCSDVQVTQPFLPRNKRGDIDLIAIPAEEPRCAVAFQAKRFKVKVDGDDERVSLDAEKLTALVRQCNETISLGFHQVYGLVLVMIDGQNKEVRSLIHRGTSERTFKRIYRFFKQGSLDPRAGVVFVEIIQPTPADPAELGMMAVGVDQWASKAEQASRLSEKVAKFAEKLRRKGNITSVQLPPLEGMSPIPVSPIEEIGLRLVNKGSELR